jgi:hypothetical protein
MLFSLHYLTFFPGHVLETLEMSILVNKYLPYIPSILYMHVYLSYICVYCMLHTALSCHSVTTDWP